MMKKKPIVMVGDVWKETIAIYDPQSGVDKACRFFLVERLVAKNSLFVWAHTISLDEDSLGVKSMFSINRDFTPISETLELIARAGSDNKGKRNK